MDFEPPSNNDIIGFNIYTLFLIIPVFTSILISIRTIILFARIISIKFTRFIISLNISIYAFACFLLIYLICQPADVGLNGHEKNHGTLNINYIYTGLIPLTVWAFIDFLWHFYFLHILKIYFFRDTNFFNNTYGILPSEKYYLTEPGKAFLIEHGISKTEIDEILSHSNDGNSKSSINKMLYHRVKGSHSPTNQTNYSLSNSNKDIAIKNSTCSEISDIGTDFCSICCFRYALDSLVTILPCSNFHIFHNYCIEKWLVRDSHCPICRCNILSFNNK